MALWTMAHGIVFCPRLRQRRHRHRHRRHHPSSLQNLPRHHRYRVIVIFVVMSSCRHVVMSSSALPPFPPPRRRPVAAASPPGLRSVGLLCRSLVDISPDISPARDAALASRGLSECSLLAAAAGSDAARQPLQPPPSHLLACSPVLSKTSGAPPDPRPEVRDPGGAAHDAAADASVAS